MALGPALTTPPRPVIRLALSLRAALNRLADALVPRQVVMAERVTAFAQAELLRTAARLGLADLLADGPRSAADLAAASHTDADALDRMLAALVHFGVFRREDGAYANNGLSETLRSGTDGSWRSFTVAMTAPPMISAWSDLENTVRSGASAFERVHGRSMWEWLDGDADERRWFADAMTAQTALQAHALARSAAFNGITRLCDIGGGHGVLLGAVLARHPETRGVLFERPEVIAGARPVVAAAGLAARVDLVGGDMFEAVPAGCDAYVLKNILHNWGDERVLRLLCRLRQVMHPEQRLLIVEMLKGAAIDPALASFSDMQMMVVHEGRERDLAGFERLLRRTGFAFRRTHVTRTLFDVVEAVAC